MFCFSNQRTAGGAYRSRRDRSDPMPEGIPFGGKRTLQPNPCFLSSRAASAKGRNAKQANRDVGKALSPKMPSPETKKAPKHGSPQSSLTATVERGAENRAVAGTRLNPTTGAPREGRPGVGESVCRGSDRDV